MGFVPGFKYDLFISYAHRNDQPWGWVSQFVQTLKAELEGKNRDINIWWDPGLRTGEDFNLAIGSAISESAVFLSVLSLAYGDSSYCRLEVEEFRQQRHPAFGMTVGSMSRMQGLVIEREYSRDRWPPELRSTSPQPFFDDGNVLFGRPSSLNASDPWIQGLWKVRDSIWALLNDMRARKEKGAVIECSYGVQSTRVSRRPTLYLADATDDLLRKRERLASALRQSEIVVVESTEPSAPPVDDPGSLSVHLFGMFPGRPFRDAPFSLPRLQLQSVLAAHPARRPLVWLPRSIDLDDVDTEEHRAFLQSLLDSNEVELLRSDFEDLKEELAQRMRAAHKPPPRTVRALREAPIIHIWHAMASPSPLAPLKRYLSENNCGISVFDCTRADPEKMQSRLAVCDGLIVSYTSETRTWAEDVMMEAFRLRRREERPTAFAAVELPPAIDEEFNFEHPRVVPVSVKESSGWDAVGDFLLRLETADA